jgi:hypothetical protein
MLTPHFSWSLLSPARRLPWHRQEPPAKLQASRPTRHLSTFATKAAAAVEVAEVELFAEVRAAKPMHAREQNVE